MWSVYDYSDASQYMHIAHTYTLNRFECSTFSFYCNANNSLSITWNKSKTKHTLWKVVLRYMFPGRWFKIKSTETPDLIKCVACTQGRLKIIIRYLMHISFLSKNFIQFNCTDSFNRFFGTTNMRTNCWISIQNRIHLNHFLQSTFIRICVPH